MSGLRLCLVSFGIVVLMGCGGSRNDPGMTNPPTTQPVDSVSGTVTFKGAPLAGATVYAWVTNSNTFYQTTTTDTSGTYSFSGITAGGNVPLDLQFWVTKPGYGFYASVGSTAKVERFDHTGNMQGTLLAGIYLTVIDYVAQANDSLTGANFAAYNGTNPLISLPRTGQIQSYTQGDDGSLQHGVAWPGTRFSDNNDGSITDNLTGLIWLKNAGCFTPAIYSTALTEVNQLANGQCGLTDNSIAGQWHMPNLNELESLIDVSQSNPALPGGNPFNNLSNTIYWTSTSYFGGEAGSPDAWTIRMSDGRYINDSVNNVKTSSLNGIWAVRSKNGTATIQLPATGQYVSYQTGDDGNIQAGVPFTFPRFADNGNGTVTDTVTGLVWLKLANCIQGSWSSALTVVSQLANGQCGLTDGSAAGSWRMPNRNEMLSLQDRMENNHADFFDQTYLNMDGTVFQSAIFNNMIPLQYYWTSTTDAANNSEAWTVYSCDFGVYDTPKSNTGYSMAVR